LDANAGVAKGLNMGAIDPNHNRIKTSKSNLTRSNLDFGLPLDPGKGGHYRLSALTSKSMETYGEFHKRVFNKKEWYEERDEREGRKPEE
jgi:hypothetical protein